MRRALLVATSLFALALPAPAFARGEFDPTTEFEQHEWVPIHLGPLDLSITKAVVYLMLGTVADDRCSGSSSCAGADASNRTAPDRRRADLRRRADADRRAGPAVEGDRPLVPVRRDAVALHLRRQPDRLHPAAAHRRDLARLPGLGHLRRDLVALGDARARAADVRLHALRGHPLERARALLQELDPGGAEGAAAR